MTKITGELSCRVRSGVMTARACPPVSGVCSKFTAMAINGQDLWAIGFSAFDSAHRLYLSTDYGVNWTQKGNSVHATLKKLNHAGDINGFESLYVKRDGEVWLGCPADRKIYRFTSAGADMSACLKIQGSNTDFQFPVEDIASGGNTSSWSGGHFTSWSLYEDSSGVVYMGLYHRRVDTCNTAYLYRVLANGEVVCDGSCLPTEFPLWNSADENTLNENQGGQCRHIHHVFLSSGGQLYVSTGDGAALGDPFDQTLPNNGYRVWKVDKTTGAWTQIGPSDTGYTAMCERSDGLMLGGTDAQEGVDMSIDVFSGGGRRKVYSPTDSRRQVPIWTIGRVAGTKRIYALQHLDGGHQTYDYVDCVLRSRDDGEHWREIWTGSRGPREPGFRCFDSIVLDQDRQIPTGWPHLVIWRQPEVAATYPSNPEGLFYTYVPEGGV